MNRDPLAGRTTGSWAFWIYLNQNDAEATILYREATINIFAKGGNEVRAELSFTGKTNTNNFISITGVTQLKWHFITITWDGATGNLKGYRDGSTTPVATKQDNNMIATMNVDSMSVPNTAKAYPLIGGKFASSAWQASTYFHGYLDDFSFWPTVMAPNQVAALFNCGVDTSNQLVKIRGTGTDMAVNSSLFSPHTGLTLAAPGWALCDTSYATIKDQGGWWPHSTARQAEAAHASVTEQTDWQGPFPQLVKGEWYLDNPYIKYRNIAPPHQGALHQLRSRKIATGGNNAYVAQNTDASFQITTGLNGEQSSWPYKLGNTGTDRSTSNIYHSSGVHPKLIPDYLGWPGNGAAAHCDLASVGGLREGGDLNPLSAFCSSHSVIGLEHSDPDGTYGYPTWAGETQGLVADSASYIGWPNQAPIQYSNQMKPVEGENGYMPTHTPHPTRQPEFYPTYGNHFEGDSGELGANEYPMSSLTDCLMMTSGSLAINTAICAQPGYKLANGLHPGTYAIANN
jgi:hypothetical protein